MFQPLNPKPYVGGLVGERVVVRLKFGAVEYRGTLGAVDAYMNLLLADDVVEYPTGWKGEGSPLGGEVFVRCNNVMWVGKAQ